MYPAFTLLPGGAFVMCEDVSEIDPNMPAPDLPPERVEAVQNINPGFDPVIRMTTRLSDIYQKDIVPLMSMDFTWEDPTVGISRLESIQASCTEAVNMALTFFCKMESLVEHFNCEEGWDILAAPFDAHAGLFMKNTARIKQQGLQHYAYSYRALPALSCTFESKRIIDALLDAPQVMTGLLSSQNLDYFAGREGFPFTASFDGIIDFMQCMFEQPDRLSRLEMDEHMDLEFDTLRGRSHSHCHHHHDCHHSELCSSVMRLASCAVKCVSTGVYEAICNITDNPSFTPEEYTKSIQPLLYKTVNTFGIITMAAYSYAYQFRGLLAWKTAVKEYTDLLVKSLTGKTA